MVYESPRDSLCSMHTPGLTTRDQLLSSCLSPGQMRALHLIKQELMTWCRHTWVRFSSLCEEAGKVSVILPPNPRSLWVNELNISLRVNADIYVSVADRRGTNLTVFVKKKFFLELQPHIYSIVISQCGFCPAFWRLLLSFGDAAVSSVDLPWSCKVVFLYSREEPVSRYHLQCSSASLTTWWHVLNLELTE